MKRERYNRILDEVFTRARELSTSKGRDYAGDANVFRNFEDVAARTGQTRLQVWSVYIQKHLLAIEKYISEGKLESEPVDSRILDVIVYLALLYAMVKDGAENEK